jgi:hypothetical protein
MSGPGEGVPLPHAPHGLHSQARLTDPLELLWSLNDLLDEDEPDRRPAITAGVIKPNQAGTVSDAFDTPRDASLGGSGAIVSHRSGETGDTFVADPAAGSGCGQLRSATPVRGTRRQNNRLLDLTDEDR